MYSKDLKKFCETVNKNPDELLGLKVEGIFVGCHSSITKVLKSLGKIKIEETSERDLKRLAKGLKGSSFAVWQSTDT